MDCDVLLLSRNYRYIIKKLVEAKVETGEDISFARLAAVTKIQRTFLSQVVNQKSHLNNDQLYLVCQALQLNRQWTEHLLTLSEWERSRYQKRKERLEKKLQIMEGKAATHSDSDRIAGIKPEALDDYFCDPMGEVVLKFLTIERYRQSPQLICERLGLSPKRWKEILDCLIASQLVSYHNNEIKVIRESIFPHAQSAAEKIRNIQARLRVTEQKLKQRNIDEFLYNWWFVANPRSKKELKIEYLHLMEKIYRQSLETRKEQVYQLSLDLISP